MSALEAYRQFVKDGIKGTVRWERAEWHEQRAIDLADAAIAELEAENERLKQVIREHRYFAGLGCRRCANVCTEDDCSGWTFKKDEGWLCPKHSTQRAEQAEAERDALRAALHRVWIGHKKWHCPTTDTEEEWMVAIGAERGGE